MRIHRCFWLLLNRISPGSGEESLTIYVVVDLFGNIIAFISFLSSTVYCSHNFAIVFLASTIGKYGGSERPCHFFLLHCQLGYGNASKFLATVK